MLNFFRQIIWGQNTRLHTGLSTTEVLARLTKHTGSPDTYEMHGPDKSYSGLIEDRKFWLLLQHRYRNGLSPKVTGEVSESDKAAIVSLHIRVAPIVWITLCIGFLCFLVLAAVLIYYSGVDEWIDIFMFFPLLIFSSVFVLVLLSIRQGMYKMEESLAKLWGVL